MTLPFERVNAIQNTEAFLLELCDPAVTPRIPSEVRRKAAGLLKHYPSKYDLNYRGHQIFKGPSLSEEDWDELWAEHGRLPLELWAGLTDAIENKLRNKYE
jgi:hypothetical protein